MLNYEPELIHLRDAGILKPDAAAERIARERREVFSVHQELRLLAWIGVMLIVTGAGIFLSKNLDRIGPFAIATGMGVVAAACYAWVFWRQRTARATLIDDYILLLGALLLSGDVAYIERQFGLLGRGWPRHLIIMAVAHGVAAYVYSSRKILTLSLVALCAWLGVERNLATTITPLEAAARSFVAAAVVLTWRFADMRVRKDRSFEPAFDHFTANLALLGAGALTATDFPIYVIGGLVMIGLAVFVILYGFRKESEAFVIYGYIYAVIGVSVLGTRLLMQVPTLLTLLAMPYMIAAIAGLFLLHMKYRKVVSE